MDLMAVHNIKDLKNARVFSQHIEAILQVINLTIKGLEMFKAYGSAQRILATLKEEKHILESHLKHQKLILSSKGQIS